MILLMLILIAFALLAGVIFLIYTFGDAVVDMFVNLMGLPKETIVILLIGMIFAVISVKFTIKLINHVKRNSD